MSLRVLHCPENTGGHPGMLARAERELGLDSRCVTLRPHPFGFSADETLSGGGPFAMQLARLHLLRQALRADVVHFNLGQTCMPQRIPVRAPWDTRFPPWMRRVYNVYAGALELRDLAWLRHRGKRIVVTYQGDDARQGEYLKRSFEISPADEAGYYSPESDRLKRRRIEAFGGFADAVFSLNPDLLYVLPRGARFLAYANVDVRNIGPAPASENAVPVVLHAPSHQGVKGTRFVIEAVNRLKSEGVALEFILVEGMPHGEAMRLYARADVLVDQLLTGWYGGLAVELMALGKPVMAYIRPSELRFLPQRMRETLPIINATPDSVYAVLKQWLTVRRGLLAPLGERSREYAETWHDPARVAAELKRTYEELTARGSGGAPALADHGRSGPHARTSAATGTGHRKRSLLMLSFSDLATDPRVARHLEALGAEYRITSCGFRAPLQPVARHVSVNATPRGWGGKLAAGARLLLRFFESAYWTHPLVARAMPSLACERFDAIFANDLLSLPLALRIAQGAPVIFDAHEYSPGELSDSRLWRLFFGRFTRYLCATYLPRARAAITVCEGIAAEYERQFGVSMRVIDNASAYCEVVPRPTPPSPIRMIHHGAAIPARRLERMIEMMEHTDERYTLDFMLMPDRGGYVRKLKHLAAGNPRIAFRDPVAAPQIVPACAQYDVGVFLLEPVNFNYQHALPNKIFEFIQARLAVVIGPSPEMAHIVRKYDCGAVAESFDARALADTLNRLSNADIDRLKANSHRAAQVHHAGRNAARLREIVTGAFEVAT